ncbi:hypothetical protein KAI92_04605 [Candidatus Parcubacteria bacterium]|nr:hypothetical protein [Candidatus Parcubacteria bacterium]
MLRINYYNKTINQSKLPMNYNSRIFSLNIKNILFTVFLFLFLLFFISLPLTAKSEEILQVTEIKTASIFVEDVIGNNTENIVFDVMVNPGGQIINAVEIYFNFATTTLEVESLNFENSFCELYVEKSFDNATGEINVICGKAYSEVNEISQIGQIIFKPIQNGWTDFNFSTSSSVLANDSFGTNILKNIENKNIYINEL